MLPRIEIMNTIEKGITTLIRSAITGERYPLPEDFVLGDTLTEVNRHSVATLVYAGAVNCGLDKNSPAMQKLFQTTILLPQLISYVIVGYIVFAFLSNEAGLVTTAIENAKGAAPNFYSERGIWPFLLTFVYNWKQIGYNSVIYLAAIAGVSQNLYEASAIDGAGRLQQIFKITLPMIKSTVITLVLLQIGRIFYSDFGLFYQVPMNSGMLFPVTNTIDTFVYRMLMVNNRLGMASAASVYQSIVGFILVLAANFVVRKVSRDDALF